MAKVIVERERRGGGPNKGYKKRLARDLARDEASFIEPMKHRSRVWLKELNENLRPLERWLGAQVGRPWSKVYSKLRERIDPRSAVQKHIWDHARYMVATEVDDYGGVLRDLRSSMLNPLREGDLYVDPKTGLLRRMKRTQSLLPKKPVVHTTLRHGMTLYAERNDIYYAIDLAPLPKEPVTTTMNRWGAPWAHGPYVHDAWLKKSVAAGWWPHSAFGASSDACSVAYGDGLVYAKSYRQVSSKVIKALGLRERAR
jgi:hypothetical protein